MMVIRWAIPIFLLFPTWALAQQVGRLKILSTGLYRADFVYQQPNPAAISGYTWVLDKVKLLKSTNRVPCRLGTVFGAEYEIEGDRGGLPIDLTVVHRYPGQGILDPKTGMRRPTDSFSVRARTGRWRATVIRLDQAYELVAGTWMFEFWIGMTKLDAISFSVEGCPKGKG